MEEVYKKIEEVISCITNSYGYQMCIKIQEKMKDNFELKEFIENIKNKQKEYIKSGYSSTIKKELDQLEEQLEEIPIYSFYQQNLKIVNEKIDFVKEYLNQYFNSILNEKY